MKKITIIGATGSLGSVVRSEMLAKTDFQLTLFARATKRLGHLDPSREIAIEGNVTNMDQLKAAVKGQDAVYVNLSGDLEGYAKNIVTAMKETGVKQIIFIASMGIYNELPGAKGGLDNYPSMLAPYRKAADYIETSGLDSTIIRPGWFDNSDNLKYQLTEKGETFIGHDISRKAIADLVISVINEPNFGKNKSLGIAR